MGAVSLVCAITLTLCIFTKDTKYSNNYVFARESNGDYKLDIKFVKCLVWTAMT